MGGSDAARPTATKQADAKVQEKAEGEAKAPAPTTPADFLDLADKAMAAEPGWTFAVEGAEALTLEEQESGASYEATVSRTGKPKALRSQGVITSSKGVQKAEKVFVVGGTTYVKEGAAAWKKGASTDPAMENKVEDSVAAIDAYRGYLKAGNKDVTAVKKGDTAELQVRLQPSSLKDVQDRAYVKTAVRELDPVLTRLQAAGITISKSQITLARLNETLTLDARTGRIEAHRLGFTFLIPHNGGYINYRQDVGEVNGGVFKESISLPTDVG
ncbi:hypothetical protein CG723_19480 [Streptomyces sp. CB01635]|uniref:hypothetical protein n=1 Tax=unclassified Streptomyces TaxID=2593676 RepID=UPI000C27D4DB|nr:hypothetical protein [Streptomyces sp. CB01635]PJN09920.1 hypothetical protein CG723_19480 [Streptomyces sp. CB01635]